VNFLNQLLRGIAFVPALVNGIEGLFASKSGAEKKDAAMSFLESALATVDAVAAREIVDPEKFKNGISKIIDGTVECLNASTWAKQAVRPQP
jgi:predicted ATP-grasp superfamily ATP-dependent carboligase